MDYLTMKEELLLLAILRLKNDAYLVNIRKHLNQSTEKSWSVGNVFVSLSKLEQQGLITPRYGDPTARRGGKAIKYYDLSTTGYSALRATKIMQDDMWNGLYEKVFSRND